MIRVEESVKEVLDGERCESDVSTEFDAVQPDNSGHCGGIEER